jgi:hypothetical protein
MKPNCAARLCVVSLPVEDLGAEAWENVLCFSLQSARRPAIESAIRNQHALIVIPHQSLCILVRLLMRPLCQSINTQRIVGELNKTEPPSS